MQSKNNPQTNLYTSYFERAVKRAVLDSRSSLVATLVVTIMILLFCDLVLGVKDLDPVRRGLLLFAMTEVAFKDLLAVIAKSIYRRFAPQKPE